MKKIFLHLNLVIGITLLFFQGKVYAEELEKIPIQVKVGGVGSFDTEVFLKEGEVFLPIHQLFKFMGVKIVVNKAEKVGEGFFIYPEKVYRFDAERLIVNIQGKVTNLTSNDFLWRDEDFYIRRDLLNSLFGLEFKYYPRRLTVEHPIIRDLPAIKRENRRKNFERRLLRGYKITDPYDYLGREFMYLGDGNLGWSFNTNYFSENNWRVRYNFDLGLQLLGGDLNLQTIGTYNYRFPKKIQIRKNEPTYRGYYRYPIFGSSAISQIIIGDVQPYGIQYGSMYGIEVTNRPIVRRYVFSRELFDGQLEPNSEVEVLKVGYVPKLYQTDEQGFYQFEIPIIYGRRELTIRTYDQWEQMREFHYLYNIPSTIIPPDEFEYSISVGRVRRRIGSKAFAGTVRWGVTSALTIGGDVRYYEDRKMGRTLTPAVTAVSTLLPELTLSAQYAPFSVSRIEAVWLLSRNYEFMVNHNFYTKDKFFNPFNARWQSNAGFRFLFPVWYQRHIAGDISISHTELYEYIRQDLRGGLYIPLYRNIRFNLSTSLIYSKYAGEVSRKSSHLSAASLNLFLPLNVYFTLGCTYNHRTKEIASINVNVVNNYIKNLEILFNYNSYPTFGYSSYFLQISYYFPYLKAFCGLTSTQRGKIGYNVGGRGSIYFDYHEPALHFDNRFYIGDYGGIVATPFLDENANGILDNNEPIISKGYIFTQNRTRETQVSRVPLTSRVLKRLPGYEEYDIELDITSLEDPRIVPVDGSYRVLIEPNSIKEVYFPLVMGGSIRGSVLLENERVVSIPGLKIHLKLFKGGKEVRSFSTLTFSNGEFEFLNLPPGSYKISLDNEQLLNLGYRSTPVSQDIELKALPNGDHRTDIKFVLR